jgi:hypothetical protein
MHRDVWCKTLYPMNWLTDRQMSYLQEKRKQSWILHEKSARASRCDFFKYRNIKQEVAFYDCVTVHHNRFLANKTNRCTEFQFFWYYYSTCFGQPFCQSPGILSHTSALIHFMALWWLHKMYQSRCMAKNWWWAERLPETCRVVISIKLEFSASVGFIHKQELAVLPLQYITVMS